MKISLGIPYATAARFAAPQPVAFDTTRADGTSFGPAAPQAVDGPLGDIVPGMKVRETDEASCLTLNVWAPPPEGEPKPVLVWLHGGSFVIGASSQPVYDGTLLAQEQDVVVVSANYRIGAFGFLDARSFGGVANCGLRDAICALEWVRDNIAAFGGDPDRVVAFGESAGGGLVLHALASPSARGLVAGAIIQSGATFATLDEKRADVVVEALSEAAGVAEPGALRDLSTDALVAAQSTAMGPLLGSVGMMPFHPMIDDELLPAAPVDAFTAGAAAGVALDRRHHRRRDAPLRRFLRRARAARADRATGRPVPRRRRAGRREDRRRLRGRARYRRHQRDLARALRRQRDAAAVPRGARRARAVRADVHVLLHVGRTDGRRVSRHRHPVRVRELRRRLGRVRRPRRRRPRARAGAARFVGCVRARPATPAGPRTPRPACSAARCTTPARTRCSRGSRPSETAADFPTNTCRTFPRYARISPTTVGGLIE